MQTWEEVTRTVIRIQVEASGRHVQVCMQGDEVHEETGPKALGGDTHWFCNMLPRLHDVAGGRTGYMFHTVSHGRTT